jgi:ubiquinone/menaquinone biosynthesis C-methylase UbiE
VTVPFTPALGHAAMSGLCVRAIVLLTRMQFWRSRLVDQVAPGAGGTVIDPGCGTGSFAVPMAQRAPGARRVSLAPDRAILWRAKARADAGEGIGLVERYARDVAALLGDGIADAVVSGRLLHGFSMVKKRQDSSAGWRVFKPGGPLHTLTGSFSTCRADRPQAIAA